MGWSTPATWVAGTVVTASDMNTYIRDNQRYLKGIGQVPTIESGLTIDNTDGDERLLLPLLSTAECSTVLNAEGEVAFDEQTHTPKYYNGSAIKDIGDHGSLGGLTDDDHTIYQKESLLTTAGDIAYATAASTWARLGIGTGLQLLRTNAGATAPEWATVTGVQVVNSTYTGNDANNRQITTGFACKLIILYADVGGVDYLWLCTSTSGSAKQSAGATTVLSTDLVLHATDGFEVDASNANVNTYTYYYCAIG